MPRRADIAFHVPTSGFVPNQGTNYVIETPTGVMYWVFQDPTSDIYYRKSTDGGITWTYMVSVFNGAGTTPYMSVWYDRWSGIAAGLIHVAYTETSGSDTLYRTIDTESSDTLSTQTTIFAGTSAVAGGGFLSISRARGGNVYCRTTIDAGAEGGFFRLPNANVPNGAWDAARTIDEATATNDRFILVPGFAADNQDMLMIFYDVSATELSRKIYDDSANTWAETSIATSITYPTVSTSGAHFTAAVDLTNSRIILAMWTAVDTANADLRCFRITESAITESSTNTVLNSTDDQGFAGISLDRTDSLWTVWYGGISSGGETWPSAIHLYTKTSSDLGATWGAETLMTQYVQDVRVLFTLPRRYSSPPYCPYQFGASPILLMANVSIVQPTATYLAGIG